MFRVYMQVYNTPSVNLRYQQKYSQHDLQFFNYVLGWRCMSTQVYMTTQQEEYVCADGRIRNNRALLQYKTINQ
jgi:hypothetical protein